MSAECGPAHDIADGEVCACGTVYITAPSWQQQTLDLVPHLHRQWAWSRKTFGPGNRTAGVIDHIRKELAEIEADPDDLLEWVDVMILAFDGAMRAGFTPELIAESLEAKQKINETRIWPDWRTAEPDKAIEHVRVSS